MLYLLTKKHIAKRDLRVMVKVEGCFVSQSGCIHVLAQGPRERGHLDVFVQTCIIMAPSSYKKASLTFFIIQEDEGYSLEEKQK